MQGLNKQLGTRALASTEALATGEGWVPRELGAFLLAGKQTALTVHELLGTVETVTEDQAALLAPFAAALAAYEAGEVRDAHERFRELVARHPGDGPSRFYCALSERVLASMPPGPWDPVVRLPLK
jgi:adenylate cyclase